MESNNGVYVGTCLHRKITLLLKAVPTRLYFPGNSKVEKAIHTMLVQVKHEEEKRLLDINK